jgi:L-asparagine transporter-like permease
MYWLAPGRRDDTLAFMRGWVRWLAVLTLGLLTVIIAMGLRANLTAPPHFPDYAPWVLAAYALLIVAMVIVLVRRFGAV